MSDRLNILSLHRMGDPLLRREAVRELETMMPAYAPEHNHIVVDADLPLPNFIKDIKFHAIILGPTFLSFRKAPVLLEKAYQGFSFIKDSEAFKIAMPQDDYDCCAVLDRWLVDWKFDLLITISPDYWSILYPGFSCFGEIRMGYTGYVSESWLADWKNPKPYIEREIDVSYRATNLTAKCGSIGNLKGAISDRFIRAVTGHKMKLDISTRRADVITGNQWHAFLENSKFCLATSSGSSLLDPEGKIWRAIQEFNILYPDATYEEIEAACFPGEDGKYIITPISPRNIEAALACTVQIATPGAYSNIMQAVDHYIPLDEDCSNINEVIEMMDDIKLVSEIQLNCKQVFLDQRDLRYKNHVRDLIETIESAVSEKVIRATEQHKMNMYIKKYRSRIESKTDYYWGFLRKLRRSQRFIYNTRKNANAFIRSSLSWKQDEY